ncbi:nucleoside 2-deoxyribosyltransferase [Shimia aestuarii]|uniref:nucleoside 2-deoxyribosyltransferase n=1 Tax=Shimia aestuarii TaxID=254406 RepID=UPI0024364AFE|nr:nucleoside 2-deoxyribosyltransferase [Shimia aestuarii]
MVKVYIAGPMFIESQIDYNLMLANRIRELGIEVYCPNENAEINDKSRRDITGEKIYKHDIDELRASNVLLCQVADCPGTNWEAGYFDCLSKEVNSDMYVGVIGLSSDIRLKTPPDPQKPGFDNQTMYLNQFMVGGLKCSLGLFYDKEDLFKKLVALRTKFDGE